jgi:prephenate dehydratase
MNLTKLESRPCHGSPFEYVFYVDFEFDICSFDEVKKVLKVLEDTARLLKILGMYKAGQLWKT